MNFKKASFVFQEVAIKELLAARGRPLRKATSVPNIHNVSSSFTALLFVEFSIVFTTYKITYKCI